MEYRNIRGVDGAVDNKNMPPIDFLRVAAGINKWYNCRLIEKQLRACGSCPGPAQSDKRLHRLAIGGHLR